MRLFPFHFAPKSTIHLIVCGVLVQVQRNLQAFAAHVLGLIRTNETCVVIKKMAILGADLSLGLLSLIEMTIITMHVSYAQQLWEQ